MLGRSSWTPSVACPSCLPGPFYTPASSEPADDTYLRHVRDADVVIWLAGPEVSPAVVNEVREASTARRRLIIIRYGTEPRSAECEALIAEVGLRAKYADAAELTELRSALELTLLGALETFENLGAGWDASRIHAALKEQDMAPRSSGGRRAYGDELSPREAEVVRLAGSGRKNREIANVLFISPRTVEAHVASAIRKLGVESKQELVAEAED